MPAGYVLDHLFSPDHPRSIPTAEQVFSSNGHAGFSTVSLACPAKRDHEIGSGIIVVDEGEGDVDGVLHRDLVAGDL